MFYKNLGRNEKNLQSYWCVCCTFTDNVSNMLFCFQRQIVEKREAVGCDASKAVSTKVSTSRHDHMQTFD